MTKKNVVIIGGGIGGLATATLLAEAGHSVTVFEKDAMLGGRAGRLKSGGFTFDTGPSWYLMPKVFEHYYQLLGESVNDQLSLKKLSPAYKVFFEHDPSITITGSIETDAQTFEQIEPGAGKALRRYVTRSTDIYNLSLDHFLYSNFERISDFFRLDVMKKIFQLPRLLLQPIDTYVGRFVTTTRLKQILEYPMVFLGTSPFSAPAMYSLMSALDFNEGVYYPLGGMYTIIESLVALGEKRHVSYKLETGVRRILSTSGKATGVELSNGEVIPADIVISNADLHFTETVLVGTQDQTYSETYWEKKEAGPSALLVYLGVKGKVPELEHHNLLLVDEWQENFESIYNSKTVPEKASIYISKTSHTDPSVAPKGDENLFILVPLPAELEWDRVMAKKMTDHYLKQIESMTGIAIQDRLVTKEVFGPGEFLTKFYSWRSSMLGQSHLLRQSAFFRTPNKSKKLQNLYYVGGSTTPGIGLPMCLIGAELVYKRIIGEKSGGRVKRIVKVDGAR
jgi:1-hydroxy-2-isopentenylcarotenoid 3,4-desaturase